MRQKKFFCTELGSKTLHLSFRQESPSKAEGKFLLATDKERQMLSKCANPSCSTQLVYLREGKVFRMENPSQAEKPAEEQANKPKPARRVEHFWLCGPCSADLTLAYDRQHKVKVIPKKYRAVAAAS
jgi:hypothetical protein